MPTITLDKIIFRNNDTYTKMYKGSELIAQVDSGGGYDYLTFTALTAGSTVNFNRPNVTTCSYSVDNGTTWTNGDNVTVTLTNIGDKVMYKGVTSAQATSYTDTTVVFTMTGGIKASGSLMSMHNGNPNDTIITYNYEFCAFFNNCSALTDITDLKLPATTLTLSCYNRLFKNTGITSVPSGFLPATTIVESSYSRMFYNCTSLTTVPSNLLPATNFQGTNCYNNMFYGCSALTTAPNLPATTLVRGCYSYMFRGCTLLTSIPDLPAKEIIYQCYYYMFAGCTLTGTVKVPFESINSSSYNNACGYMFNGCNGITGAEVGTSAGYASVNVFSNMFRNCSLLSSIKCLANYSSNISYSNWVTGVASSGTFVKATGQGWNTGNSGIPTGWTVTEQSPVVPVPEVKGYVTLTNNGNSYSSISVSNYNSMSNGRLVYSTDGTTWNWLTDTPVTILPNNSLYIAGDMTSSASYNLLSITGGSVSASGNARYLYECSSETPGTMPSSALTYRFYNCTGLVDASGLVMPSTISYSCYSYMFYGCTSLTSVPSLSATTLAGNCYYGMFQGCTSLTSIPNNFLPATTLTSNCYYNMFNGCTGLTTAPNLPATTLAGTCYYGMFRGCTSLTTAPSLPATTLATSCYSYMFYGCSSLNSITVAYEGSLSGSSYTTSWVDGVAATGTFTTCPNNYWTSGVNGIPTGWTVVETGTPAAKKYVTLTHTGGNTMSAIKLLSLGSTHTMYYRTTKTNEGKSAWTPMVVDGVDITFTVNGDTIDLAGTMTGAQTTSSCTQFVINGGGLEFDSTDTNGLKYLWDYGYDSRTTLYDYAGFKMFRDCSGLKNLPPVIYPGATSIPQYCYSNMFYGCTNITSIPSGFLPATSLSQSCYSFMFYGCTGLTSVPSNLLPATSVPVSGYSNMFYGCTALATVPQILPATTVESGGYRAMFRECTSLESAPDIEATTVGTYSMYDMFYGCTKLKRYPPHLYPTTLTEQCYNQMFYNCGRYYYNNYDPQVPIWYPGPEIHATTGSGQVCGWMFNGSTVNSLKVHWSNWSSSYTSNTYKWVNEVITQYLSIRSNGKIYVDADNASTLPPSGESSYPSAWTVEIPVPEVKGYVTLTNNGNTDSSVSMNNFTMADKGKLVYSTDGETWNWLTGTAVTIEPNGTLYLAGNEASSTSDTKTTNQLSITGGEVAVSGWASRLYNCSANSDGTNIPSYGLFARFKGCTGLTDAYDLNLSSIMSSGTSHNCESMFEGCSNLTRCAQAPSNTPGQYAYKYIYKDCTSLVTPGYFNISSTIPAYCLYGAFQGCTSLTQPSRLSEMNSRSEGACAYMYSGCTSLTTTEYGIPYGGGSYSMAYMFENCTSIVNRPSIPSLHDTWGNSGTHALEGMFKGCTGIDYCTFMGSLGNNSVNSYMCASMFEGCTSLTGVSQITLGNVSSASVSEYAFYRMFKGCTALRSVNFQNYNSSSSYSNYALCETFYGCINLTSVTGIQASYLYNYSLQQTFKGCTSLTTAPKLFASSITTIGQYACCQTFSGCTGLTSLDSNFTLPATTIGSYGYFGMFDGCSNLASLPSGFTIGGTTLSEGACNFMFRDCTSLTALPENMTLPATTLAKYCYSGMFRNCTSLSSVPSGLISAATNIGTYTNREALSGMFYGCTSLTTAPDIPNIIDLDSLNSAATFSYMFYGCSSLNNVTSYLEVYPHYTEFTNWLRNVSATGDFYNLGGALYGTGDSGIPSGWTEHLPTPPISVPTSVSIFNQYNDGTTPSSTYGTLTENTNDYTYSHIGNSYSDLWSGVDIMLPYDCSSFTYHVVASIPGGATSGVNVVAPNASGNPTNQMSSGSTSFDSDITVTRPSSATQGNDWRLRTYIKRDGSKSDLTPITVTIPKSTI